MSRAVFVAAAFALGLAWPQAPEQVPDRTRPDQAFLVVFDSDKPAPPTKFRLWYDGAIVKNFTNAEVRAGKAAQANADGSFTYTLSAPGLSLRDHDLKVSEFDATGEERFSTPILLSPDCYLATKK